MSFYIFHRVFATVAAMVGAFPTARGCVHVREGRKGRKLLDVDVDPCCFIWRGVLNVFVFWAGGGTLYSSCIPCAPGS